ncbi:MAG: aminotransferase, partial [Saprospiraceae bacterium]
IIHTPNHKGFKGTEFIVNTIERLKTKGLKIDFRLCEKMPNSQIKEIMLQSDILIEQIIANTYSLNAIEGLATGLTVISNLQASQNTKIFEHYSYLSECPIQSANIDSLEIVLEKIIVNPHLRNELQLKGIEYVNKYHGEKAAQFLFENIYQKIWYKKNIDLMNLYHPIQRSHYENISF